MPRRSVPLPIIRPLLALLALLALVTVAPGPTFKARAQPTTPLIQLTGNGQTIANGDTSPTAADGTELGTVRVGGQLTSIFAVNNIGVGDLNLTATPAVTITGSADFSVSQQPSSPIIGGGSAPFIVRFLPTITGTQTATVSIASDDSGASPYTFTVQATGFTGPAIALDLTVGTGGGCPSTTSARVAPGTTVNYCYRVVNTGTVTVTTSSLTDTAYGALLTDSDLTLAPDGAYFLIVPQVVTVTTVSTATWTVANPGPTDVATATDSVTVVAEFEAPAFTSGAPPAGTYGGAYSHTFAGTGLPAPAFSVSAGALPPGLALDGPSGVLTGTLTAAGTYTFTVTAANGVNPAATQEVSISVAPAPLTITADNKAMVAGQPLPQLTASYSGLVNGDTPASLDTPVALSTTATSASPAGTFPIIASGAADPNYTITFVAGTLTVRDAKVYLPLVIR